MGGMQSLHDVLSQSPVDTEVNATARQHHVIWTTVSDGSENLVVITPRDEEPTSHGHLD